MSEGDPEAIEELLSHVRFISIAPECRGSGGCHELANLSEGRVIISSGKPARRKGTTSELARRLREHATVFVLCTNAF